MNCREIQDLLTPYLLGDLEPAQAAEVRAHLQICELCRDSVEDLQATLQLLREGLADTSAVPPQLPETFILQFKKRRWRRPRIAKPKSAPRWWGSRITQWTAVAAVLMILAGLMLPNLESVREKARRVNDLSNLNAIWKFASAWGLNPSDSFRPALPMSLDQLVKEAKITPEMLVSTETGEPIEYYPGATEGDSPILVSHGKTGRNVVKVAGQGMWIADGTPEAEALTKQLAGLPKQVASVPKQTFAKRPPSSFMDYWKGSLGEISGFRDDSQKVAVRGSFDEGAVLVLPPLEAPPPPPSKAASIADANFKRQKEARFFHIGGAVSADKSDESGGGSGSGYDDTLSGGDKGAIAMADAKSYEESRVHEVPVSPSLGDGRYALAAAPERSDKPADALELEKFGSAERKEESAKPLEIAALSSIRRDSSRLTADYGAAGLPVAAALMPKQETKAETKEVKVTTTAAALKTAVTRITVAAPSSFIHAETPQVAPVLQMAEVKVGTDMSKKIEGARIARLQGVQKFQKDWDVGGEKRAISPVSGTPTNTVPPQEPAATNAPPVTVPICRATGVNPFISAAAKPFSTFSIDVDTASYTLSRNYLLRGLLPPPEAVRTEEFVNYFDYAYTPPNGPTFAVYTDCGPSAFGRGLSLLKIGVKGRRLGREEKRNAILTLLIDTSGSMATPDRIELVKSALSQMVERLDPADKVAIVQYDSHARLLLEHTPASDKKRILAVIEGLQTSGSTALEEGMREAYATAARGFNSAGCNRVLLLSDGMANLGTTAAEEILKSIEGYRKQGITLSVFGFGLGAYNDVMLETLANKGDGVYSFIDSPAEAKRVLVDDLAATVNLIARDVKIQVEFNPKRVKQYRQLGYENRQLKKEEFRDDSVDAGEIGSGQSVTALYEFELQGDSHEPLGVVRVRCRNALTGQIEEIEQPIAPASGTTPFEAMDVRFRLAAAAAEFSEILRGSPFAAGSRFEDAARVLRPIALELSLDNRIQELLRLTQTGLTPKFQEAENP